MFGRELCSVCGAKKTRRKDEAGNPICPACEMQKMLDQEEKRKCPVDGSAMEKEVVEDIIIDRCPKCGGVWLDDGEIGYLRDIAESEDAEDAALRSATLAATTAAIAATTITIHH